MTKLSSVIALAVVLFAFSNLSYGSSDEEKPTFTDCRPHIDATIRNLAAKAVNAGEEPTEPQSADYVSPEEDNIPSEKVPEKVQIQEHEANKGRREQKTPINTEMFISVKQALEWKRQRELETKHDTQKPRKFQNKTQQSKKSKSSKKKSGKFRTHHHSAEKVKKSNSPKGKNKKHIGQVDKSTKSKEKSKKFEKHEKKRKHKKHNHFKATEENEIKTESDEGQKEYSKYDKNEKKEEKVTKADKDFLANKKPGLFNRIIGVIFGTTEKVRDKKFSTPWTSHEEFIRKPTDKAKKIVDKGPGVISRLINKCVAIIFGLPKTERGEKWSQPWQTHPEFVKISKSEKRAAQADSKQKPWENKGFFNFNFLNSFIELIFKKPTTKRDPKFSQPWQTHKEFQKKKVTVNVKEFHANHSKPEKGGILNGFVSMFFEIPSGDRDAKWAQPWQSHAEFTKKETKKKAEPTKKIIETGVIGGLLNKAVFLVFTKPAEARGSKWSQPWQTHSEFVKVAKEKVTATVANSKKSGFIGSIFNAFVELIFGKGVDHRDSKFSKPWQTHKEFTKSTTNTNKREILKESTSTDKNIYKQKPVEMNKYAEEDETVVQKQPKMKEYTKVEEENKPKMETRPAKPSEKPAFHHHPKDEQPSPIKDIPADVVNIPQKSDRPVLENVAEQKKERKERIIEFDEQIVVVPSHARSRDHIDTILGLDEINIESSSRMQHSSQIVLKELKDIYENAISPLEKTYKYQDISNRHVSDAELYGPPVVLLLGPYSTGKSSFINYLLGVEFTKRALKTGTPPSHGVFRIIQYGDHDRDLEGTEVSGQWLFSSLQKFGQNFVDQIKGKTLNVPLLKKATFIEAPGVLEMRRPNERLYPLNDVLQWFIDRADLILVMFDYTKLDAGYEMEAILDQLKGREAQTRILLNKADQVPPEELIKVQGSLFWNLSPLLGVNAPPTVYAGSYASFQYRPTSPIKLFEAQEEALLHDISAALNSRVNNRIAIIRRHAVRVRNHAQMIDTYLNTFYKNKGFLTSKHKLADDIIESPHDYNIYEGLTLQSNVSRYDLPDAEVYRDFFRIHNLYDFRTLRQTCSYIGGCPLDKIDAAINKQLPDLVKKYKKLMASGETRSQAPPNFGQAKPSHAGAHAQYSGKL